MSECRLQGRARVYRRLRVRVDEIARQKSDPRRATLSEAHRRITLTTACNFNYLQYLPTVAS